jgi:hypothetical protein
MAENYKNPMQLLQTLPGTLNFRLYLNKTFHKINHKAAQITDSVYYDIVMINWFTDYDSAGYVSKTTDKFEWKCKKALTARY